MSGNPIVRKVNFEFSMKMNQNLDGTKRYIEKEFPPNLSKSHDRPPSVLTVIHLSSPWWKSTFVKLNVFDTIGPFIHYISV